MLNEISTMLTFCRQRRRGSWLLANAVHLEENIIIIALMTEVASIELSGLSVTEFKEIYRSRHCTNECIIYIFLNDLNTFESFFLSTVLRNCIWRVHVQKYSTIHIKYARFITLQIFQHNLIPFSNANRILIRLNALP